MKTAQDYINERDAELAIPTKVQQIKDWASEFFQDTEWGGDALVPYATKSGVWVRLKFSNTAVTFTTQWEVQGYETGEDEYLQNLMSVDPVAFYTKVEEMFAGALKATINPEMIRRNA